MQHAGTNPCSGAETLWSLGRLAPDGTAVEAHHYHSTGAGGDTVVPCGAAGNCTVVLSRVMSVEVMKEGGAG